MSERIFEETAVIIKRKHTVRILEYKESGSEFTEINVYDKELKEEDDELSDHFAFGFTVKGKGDEEKAKIENMNEREFEEFIRHMTIFLEKKYNVVHHKEVKKEDKKEKEDKEEDIEEIKAVENDDDCDIDSLDEPQVI